MGKSKGSVDGVQSDVKVVEMRTIWKSSVYDVLLRVLAFLLTLTATIIVGVDKETKIISYSELQFKVTAKWEYMSAIVFFLVSNAIGCSYAAISMVISTIARTNGNKTTLLIITVLDLIIMALLFSANGAGAAVGVLGQKGNSHVQWMKVCNIFDAYCRHTTVALVLSIIGSSIFLLIVVHSVFKLHYYRSN
ncbi:CASP-like protein vit_07s0104g01350-like protein [Trifolium pratense]|uniref:CASP-like protein n=1 Tax=Trifolium pratense TaxID=57577 RepID=A0A2K3NMZ3_TRIPR|nr:CASP-like protein 1E1 [Trifolium pratense]PNY04412.1 CASP-like protein vit_07s0104g01350-like protein [Trifolium pratense]